MTRFSPLLLPTVILLVGLSLPIQAQQASNTVASPEYRVGQIWKYNAPPSAEGSLILILKVSKDGGRGAVIHIRVLGVPIRCGNVNVETSVGHLAVTEKALRKSTTELVDNVD